MENLNIQNILDDRIDYRITNNPSFKDQLHKVFKTLSEPIKWNIFEDGSFEIIGGMSQDKDKSTSSIVRFKMDNGFLSITTAKSTLTKLRKFIAGMDDDGRFEEFKDLKAKDAPFVNTVETSCGMFTDEGIELAHMDFLDDYIVKDAPPIKSNDYLASLARKHLPVTLEVPEDMFYSFPLSQDTTYSRRTIKYRLLSDLTIVNTDSCIRGKTTKPVRRINQYPAATKNPELVETNGISFSNEEYYRQTYSTNSVDELNKKIGIAFLHGMKEASRTKDTNPQVYENVRKRVSEHLGILYVAPGDDPAITAAVGRAM